MTPLDTEFFESYKALDTLCADALGVATGGASAYIEEMEKSTSAARLVPYFDEDYKALKHLRWVRNQLAHEANSAGMATETDLLQVRDFHDRLLKGQDPLAMLERQRRERERAAHKPKTVKKPVTSVFPEYGVPKGAPAAAPVPVTVKPAAVPAPKKRAAKKAAKAPESPAVLVESGRKAAAPPAAKSAPKPRRKSAPAPEPEERGFGWDVFFGAVIAVAAVIAFLVYLLH